ncbi:hypothetical protein BC937DRAFT_88581, partial [Endogone sp. FLAS-F59071]
HACDDDLTCVLWLGSLSVDRNQSLNSRNRISTFVLMMVCTRQIAKKSTGGKAPRKPMETEAKNKWPAKLMQSLNSKVHSEISQETMLAVQMQTEGVKWPHTSK